MQFADKVLKCIGCSTEFVFTADEQLFFFDKKFTNDPKRCKACKAKRGAVRHKALPETRIACAACGQDTTVPFTPRQGRPVLCLSCFRATK